MSQTTQVARERAGYRISEIASLLRTTPDTLRYYEKIGLLPKVTRSVSGVRHYSEKDLSRLRFIQRAQKMDFTLADIAKLLRMREAPQTAKKQVREMTARKMSEVDARLEELRTLRNELQLLVNLCTGSKNGCPIITEIDKS